MTELQELLVRNFGWSEFKPGQSAVIARLLQGKSTLAVFPTGGGKSLCYQLPALQFSGLTVVVSPLIALMKDQIDQLSAKGVTAVRLDSSLSNADYREAMNLLRGGEAKLLYVAPERFFNERFRSSLESVKISLFAIDEAHCISQWGHNFRPDYLKLAAIAQKFNAERVLALTATATPAVQDDICRAFEIKQENVICTEFFRPNLHIRTRLVDEQERTAVLIENIKTRKPGATIVYVTLQKTAEQVAAACVASGLSAKAYHAGMDSEQRHEIQEWFMAGQANIVVATIAFGMGIDKANIRYVYHFNLPKSIENYAQEIGRAGRDGEVSRCESLLVPSDRITLENFVYGDTPSGPSVGSLINEIAGQPEEFFISQYSLSYLCDIKALVTKTLLTYLELDGYLESTAPRYDSYSFKPLVASSIILANFTGERQQFARQVLASSKKSKVWFHIDVPQTMNKLGCERSRIVKALDYFAEQGWIELRVSGLVHGYRKLKSIASVDELAAEYTERMAQREKSEIDRIDQVLEMARARTCQAGLLSAHFGQPLDSDCGQCSHCQNEGPLEFELPPAQEISGTTIKAVKSLVSQHPAVLNTSRSIARFLCGLTSPALTRSKLSRHAQFGVCHVVPFAEVMRQVEGMASQPSGEPPF